MWHSFDEWADLEQSLRHYLDTLKEGICCKQDEWPLWEGSKGW